MIPLPNVASSADEANDPCSPARSLRGHGSNGAGTWADSAPPEGPPCACCFESLNRRWRSQAPLSPQSTPSSSKYSQALMVDVASRVIFPAMFFVFNLVYWPYYLV